MADEISVFVFVFCILTDGEYTSMCSNSRVIQWPLGSLKEHLPSLFASSDSLENKLISSVIRLKYTQRDFKNVAHIYVIMAKFLW